MASLGYRRELRLLLFRILSSPQQPYWLVACVGDGGLNLEMACVLSGSSRTVVLNLWVLTPWS